jgi:hypothetical protein
MFKNSLALGIVAGLLAGIAGVVYARIYHTSLGADFSKVVSTIRIITASVIGGVLAAIGYTLLDKWLKSRGEIVFNLIFTLISFATLLAPFAVKLPMDLEAPELFPGMVIPMHFFPALGWYTLKPIFIRSK